MSNKASTIKRVITSERNRNKNKIYKSMIKTLTKKFFKSINAVDKDVDCKYLETSLANLYSKIDKAVQKGVFHSNNGSRKKASLSRALKNLIG